MLVSVRCAPLPRSLVLAAATMLVSMILGTVGGCGGSRSAVPPTPPPTAAVTTSEAGTPAPRPGPAVAPAPGAASVNCTDGDDCARKGDDARNAGQLEKAAAYLSRSCQQASLFGCLAFEALYNDKSLPADATAARTRLTAGCDLGSSTACAQLALRLAKGQGGPMDLGGARAALEKACHGNGHTSNKSACVKAGFMYYEAEGGAKDEPRARALFTEGCQAKKSEGCAALGVMKLKGQGGPTDADAAVRDFTDACEDKRDPSPVACRYAGIVYGDGVGTIAADATRARGMFDKGCKLGDQVSCQAAASARSGRGSRDPSDGDGDGGGESAGGRGAGASANLAIGSMTANGLTVKELSCKLVSVGLLGAIEIVGSLAAQKAALRKCEAGGGKPRVTWNFLGGRTKVTRVQGASGKAAEACIASAMARVTSSLEGTCSAIIVIE